LAKDLESLVAQRALQKGLLAAEPARRLLSGECTLRDLLASGDLSETALQEVVRELGGDLKRMESSVTVAGDAGLGGPPGGSVAPTLEMTPSGGFASRSPSAAGPGSLPPMDERAALGAGSWGSYERAEFIAEGGMGRLYKAYDHVLKRAVALKFLAGDSPEQARRFLQEARAQARIEHPNVCRIYEAGEFGGRPFIAMQYVKGETLEKAARGLPLERTLDLVKKVAEAVHAAHALGLIHRDIKPSNVMVEETAEGGLEPYVMDFGLAREAAAPSLTLSGVIVGTPNYMAPEQARGDTARVDRRTDVYSLGATLYEVLAGRPPFEGGTAVDVLSKVLADSPVTPRRLDPAIPSDVETIVLKCLEKEPHRRYDSAKALAEDLGRYLEGEPVQARRASLAYRAVLKARKHKAVVAVGGVGFAVVLALAALWAHSRWDAAKRARLAQQLGQEVERIDHVVRVAHLLPLHDIRPERAIAREALDRIEETAVRVGKSARGPAAYAQGRGYLALGRPDLALEELREAWELGYRTPEAACALGLAEGRRFLQELDAVRTIRNRELREIQVREAERLYRTPALEHLRLGRLARLDAPEYVEGLMALYEKRYDEGLRKARTAYEKVPWLYESKILESDLLESRGNSKRDRGDYAGAKEDYALALAAIEEASRAGQSDPAVYRQQALLHQSVMLMALYGTGENIAPAQEAAVSAGRKALAADPADLDSILALSSIYRVAGEYALRKGQDPVPMLEEALSFGRRATGLAPESGLCWHQLGIAYQLMGRHRYQVGKDPLPEYGSAADAIEKAVRLDPGFHYGQNSLGVTLWYKGQYEAAHGTDPRPSLRAAAERFKKAAELAPDYESAYGNLGGALNDLGAYQAAHGEDPEPAFAEAAKAFEKGLALNPKLPDLLNNAGTTCSFRAEYALSRGRDPSPFADQAQDYYHRALETDPRYVIPLFNQADVLRSVIRFKTWQGQDPARELERARKFMAQVTAARPDMPIVWVENAALDLLEADWLLASGGDPRAACLRAREHAAKAAALDPAMGMPHRMRAQADLLEARWRMARGESVRTLLVQAETGGRRAAELDPSDAEAFRLLAEIRLRAMEAGGTESPQDFSEEAGAGIEDADRALAANPSYAEALAVRGALRLWMAGHGTDAARDTAGRLGAEDLHRAFALNPLLTGEWERYFDKLGLGQPRAR
jgi:predicted Ser/Thr protein kinase